LTLLIVKPVAAYDHLLARHRAGETDVRVISNSWGLDSGRDFNPDDAVNVASWYAFRAGMLSLFSAGNSGEACETSVGLNCWTDYNTLNNYAKAPHVLGVAATDDDKHVTDFSSRGRRPGHEWGDNYKRKKALDNLYEYHAAPKTDEEVSSGSFTGTVGPGAQDVGAGESEFHEWSAPSKAGYVEAELSWTPSAEDIDFYLREGAPDGKVVASGASLAEPESLAGLVEGGTTYYFEVRPYVNVAADYEITFTAYEGAKRDVTPMGLYRLGVGAPGELVMSTLEPTDPLQAYYEDTEVWYGRISGTSMSCPVTAGAATLVYDAAIQNGHDPDPIDVLNTLEATAEDVHDEYKPWNIGAGFIDVYEAVTRAEDGRWAPFGEVKLVDE
jgi:subtilisin family serine protease